MNNKGISTTQLAKICGVSQGTVDRALNNRAGISPATREKILAAAREYGYRPNIHARSIAGGRSMLVGVVVFDLKNQYFSDILTAVERELALRGYSMVTMFTDKDAKSEIDCIDTLYHMSADGIVLCPINGGDEYENYLLSLNMPIVTIGNRLEKFPHIGIDDAQAMRETVEYVLNRGYDRLIYVKPRLNEANTFAQTERLNAFYEACRAGKAEFVVCELPCAEREILPGKKNAFICPTDIYAVRLYNFAQQNDVGIIGFDNIRLIDELGLKLDSVAYDINRTAKAASDYIIDGQSAATPVGYTLIARGSI